MNAQPRAIGRPLSARRREALTSMTGGAGEPTMNMNRLSQCVVAVVGLVIAGCGPDAPEDASTALSTSAASCSSGDPAPDASEGGALFCDYRVSGPHDVQDFVAILEIDRTNLADRPGFETLWAPA